jgi:hypothetical protein
MLLAKYVVGPEGKAGAEITISAFPGDTGGIEANVNRWRRQIGLQGVSGEELQQLLSPLELSEGTATVVDMAGTSMDQGEPSRLVAATVPRGGETWFYKLLGPESLVASQKEAFLEFVRSADYSHAH